MKMSYMIQSKLGNMNLFRTWLEYLGAFIQLWCRELTVASDGTSADTVLDNY